MGIREEDYEDEEKLAAKDSEQDHDEEENPPNETDEDGDDESTKTNAESAEEGNEAETDEEREAIRERRRLERQRKKEQAKEEKETLRRELAARDQLINEMRQRLDVVERKSTGSEAAQIDAAIKRAVDAQSYYKQQIVIATAAQDGAALAEAQENMFKAMRAAEDLGRVKQAYVQRQAQPAPLDPRLKNHADNWLSKNKWYNPAGKDDDSRIALTVDSAMAQEGWDPTTPQYWEELDSRLKRYLPHRYSRSTSQGQSVSKPRSVPVAGSGKESSGASTQPYKLSADRVAALKEAGMWNDPALREQAIKRFREYDKQNRA